MSIQYLFEDGTSDRAKVTTQKRVEPLVKAEMRTEEVLTHIVRLARGYDFTLPGVGVLGIRLPRPLISKVCSMFRAGTNIDPTMARGYESWGVARNTYVKELEKFLGILGAFYSGTMEVFVLMIHSLTASRKKKRKLVTLLASPPTIFHLREVRESFIGALDTELVFNAPLSPEIKGVVSSVRWAIEACALFHTDSAQFIEIHFQPMNLHPEIRFNTGRILATMTNNPWICNLLNMATFSVAQGFFEDDDPPIFVSIIFSPEQTAFTGVKIRSEDPPPYTASAGPAPVVEPSSKTNAPDGPATDTPGPGPEPPTPTDGSPTTPDRPRAS